MRLSPQARTELLLAADVNLRDIAGARVRFDAYLRELEAGDDAPEDVENILRGFIWGELEYEDEGESE